MCKPIRLQLRAIIVADSQGRGEFLPEISQVLGSETRQVLNLSESGAGTLRSNFFDNVISKLRSLPAVDGVLPVALVHLGDNDMDCLSRMSDRRHVDELYDRVIERVTVRWITIL